MTKELDGGRMGYHRQSHARGEHVTRHDPVSMV